MQLTIIETGRPPGPLIEVFPAYPAMFASLLEHADAKFDFKTVSVIRGDALPDLASVEAILITGSPLGVYDEAAWMEPLRQMIRNAAEKKIPMVGVCFGHQIMADAFGGEVRKSEKGWGVGRHTYTIHERRDWMIDAGASFSLAASHQDQVITLPPGAHVLAGSEHTAFALLEYRDFPGISFQGHPEFTDGFAATLYNHRRGVSLTDEQADEAIGSLSRPDDNALVAEWIVAFLSRR
ncbi:type 1 glutamine amidotransferase [bacterium]|nr:type 1 glutamine amidotransferase [bacterium]